MGDRDKSAIYADLHVHTDHSDGMRTLDEVLDAVCTRGLRAVAITDHDTVTHWDEVRAASEARGIEAVRGVEMSCYDDAVRKKVHVVGLWLGPEVPHVKALCDQVLAGRNRYHRVLAAELAEKGYPIDYADVERRARFGTVFKMHLFQTLMATYPDEMSVGRYRELFAGKTAYEVDSQMGYPGVEEGIAAIRADGGIAVLAHPCEYDNYDEVEQYVGYGLQGVEVSHPSMKEADYPRTLELAERFGLARSGGSDFHDFELTPYLGDYGLDAEAFEALKAFAASAGVER